MSKIKSALLGVSTLKMSKARRLQVLSLSALVGTAVAQGSAFAAEYSLQQADITTLGDAGTDTANSLIGVVVDLIPVMIPLIVVYFVIRVILHYFGRK